MSQESVEIVAAAYEALADEGLDRWIEYWRRDLEHRGIEGAPDDRGPIYGKDAMRVCPGLDRSVRDFRIEPIEWIDAGENTVVAILRFGGGAKLSRIKTDQTMGAVFQIRDGKITRGREYATRSEALEAAGLSA